MAWCDGSPPLQRLAGTAWQTIVSANANENASFVMVL
jgi:hypothetical protein